MSRELGEFHACQALSSPLTPAAPSPPSFAKTLFHLKLGLSQEEVKAVVVLTGQFVVDVSQLLGNEQGVRVSAGHRRTLRAGTGHLQLLDVRGGETLGTVCRLTRSGDCIEFFVELRVSVGGDILHYGAEVCQSAIEAIKLSRDVHGGGVTYNEY